MDKTVANIFEGMTSLREIKDVGRCLTLERYDQGNNRIEGLITLSEKYFTKDMTVVEIGSFAGVSTWALAHYAGEVIAVEPHGDFAAGIGPTSDIGPNDYHIDTVIDSFAYMLEQNNNVKHLKMFSEDAAKLYDDDSVDGIYIDADHSGKGVTRDIKAWFPKVRPGGVIAGHDWGYGGIKVAIIKFVTYELEWDAPLWRDMIDTSFEDTSWAFVKP